MKKRILTISFKKLIAVLSIIILVNTANAQCSANFINSNVGGGVVNFTSTSVGTNSVTTYYWQFGNGANFFAVGNINASYNYPYNGIFNVILTIVDTIAPCTSSIAITLTVNNVPCIGNANFTSNQGQNGNVQFNNTSTGLPQNATWAWGFGDGGTSNLYSPAHTYTASGVYNVTLTGTDQLSICSYSTTQNITVTIASCSLTSAFSYTTMGGGLVNFSSLSTGTTGTTSYYWGFGDGGTSGAINPSHTYTSNGIYTVSLMLNDSVLFFCTNTSTQTINLNLPCMANVNFSMMKDSLQMPAIVWSAVPNYPLNIVAANWTWGDGSNTLALYPSHTYSAAGLYSICVSITVSCGSTATSCFNTNVWKSANPNENAIAVVNVVSVTPTSLKKINAEQTDIKLFPNPNNGEFELMIGDVKNYSEILIYNIIGKEVYRSGEISGNASLNKKINLSELSNGTYFIKVNSENGSRNSKFIINK